MAGGRSICCCCCCCIRTHKAAPGEYFIASVCCCLCVSVALFSGNRTKIVSLLLLLFFFMVLAQQPFFPLSLGALSPNDAGERRRRGDSVNEGGKGSGFPEMAHTMQDKKVRGQKKKKKKGRTVVKQLLAGLSGLKRM